MLLCLTAVDQYKNVSNQNILLVYFKHCVIALVGFLFLELAAGYPVHLSSSHFAPRLLNAGTNKSAL